MLNLFKPGKIGKLRVKNRIVMAPMGPGGLIELDGRYSQRGIDYYARRAEGGTGFIITGIAFVDMVIEPHFIIPPFTWRPRADSTLYMARFEELATAVHAYGSKICIQLTAGRGRIAMAAEQREGRAIAPSPIPCYWPPHNNARELTIEEIETLVKDFGISAGIVKAAGIDAVELHGHEGYLLDQFTTSLWNKRTDKYGGSLGKRLRFPIEIIESIRTAVGPDYPILYKFGANHHLEGGREVEESGEMARLLQDAGIDAFEVDAGCYDSMPWVHPTTYMEPGCLMDGIEAIKKAVDVPVIAVGKLGYPKLAEEILETGKADFIALGRPLLADPDWPIKVMEGKLDDVRMCIGCHVCIQRSVGAVVGEMARYVGKGIVGGKHLSCALNPATGNEKEMALTPAQNKKNVLVVGGGPAGMEAARVAVLRGHNVTLWEKSGQLGGNVIPASVPDFKNDLKLFMDYQSTQVRKLGVEIELMKEATPELVCRMKPDEVFIATGAVPVIPEFTGTSQGKVISAVDVLLGKKDIGDDIIVIGGNEVGCETAVWLAQKGKGVTIVVASSEPLHDMFPANKMDLLEMLDKAGVKILTNTEISRVMGADIAMQSNGKSLTLKADTLVMAKGMKAERGLLDELEGKIPAVHAVGDCVEPRRIWNAIWEAYNIARVI